MGNPRSRFNPRRSLQPRFAFPFIFLLLHFSAFTQTSILVAKEATDNRAAFESVRIGGRTWMARNLDVVTYRNGDSIPNISDTREWTETKGGAWCHYGNDTFFARNYGRLYNWKAVTDLRGLCPTGWRIPDASDWSALADSLGGTDVAAGPLKSTVNWTLPNTGATNATGFGANPSGFRFENGFSYLGENGYWWCRDEEDETFAFSVVIMYRESGLYLISNDKSMGLSVRCIKEDPQSP